MRNILHFLGFHKWVGPHYHKDTDFVSCNGGCWCEICGYIR